MKDKELDESLTELGFSRELVNYFPDYETLKNTYALRELQDRYEMIKHPVAAEILKLLAATIDFRAATSSDFRKMRETSLSDAELLSRLDSMAAAINDYTAQLTSLELNQHEKSVYSAALDYCRNSIKDRIKQLKETKDRIYTLYTQNDNALKQLIDSK